MYFAGAFLHEFSARIKIAERIRFNFILKNFEEDKIKKNKEPEIEK